MGTEVAVSFSSLRAQLENEKSTLYKIDENIKKIVQSPGRFSDRFKNPNTDYGKGNLRLGNRNSYPNSNQYRNDELFGNKKGDTKTVFSRLSARAHDDDDFEDDGPGSKRIRMSSAVSRELPSKADVVRAQGGDEQARTRNRRIFGSLLGTLQKFKQEEIVLQTKVEKKAQVERKIEEQARQQKEKEISERKTLFAERENKKATIRALEVKMARVKEFERWEDSQKCLGNFILTKTKPHVYWIPKKMSEKAEEKLNSSRSYHEKMMIKKRQELQDDLQRIEHRCLNAKGPGTKENDPETHHHSPTQRDEDGELGEDGGKKRDKFAMDVDEKEKEDSDGEERQETQNTSSNQDDVEAITQQEDDENREEQQTSQDSIKNSQENPADSENHIEDTQTHEHEMAEP